MLHTTKGNVAGILAILSWGGLGALGAKSASMPPYLLLGLCFLIAAALGSAVCVARKLRPASLLAPEILISAGLIGIYHLAYFEAFHHAEAIPVSLINYLWPACLILVGNLFFGLNSGWPAYFGAATGFLGVAALIGGGVTLQLDDVVGYGFAFAGAILWAFYSNVRRRAAFEGTGAMVSVCFLAALLCFSFALASGEAGIAPSADNIVVILLLGLGPAGGAFFLWDYGMRHGDAALLSVLGYSAPVLSTALMLALGMGTPTWATAIAVALITLGGVIVQFGNKASRSRPAPDKACVQEFRQAAQSVATHATPGSNYRRMRRDRIKRFPRWS